MATLFTKNRQKIVESILESPDSVIGTRELAKKLDTSPSNVSRVMKVLSEQNILKNGKPDLSNPYVRALKVLFNVQKVQATGVDRLFKGISPTSAGIYGSWANGTNGKESDIDIWVKTDKRIPESKIAVLQSDIRKAVGREAHLLVLSAERREKLRNEDPVFYYSLVYNSIVLFGDILD